MWILLRKEIFISSIKIMALSIRTLVFSVGAEEKNHRYWSMRVLELDSSQVTFVVWSWEGFFAPVSLSFPTCKTAALELLRWQKEMDHRKYLPKPCHSKAVFKIRLVNSLLHPPRSRGAQTISSRRFRVQCHWLSWQCFSLHAWNAPSSLRMMSWPA